MNSLLTIAMTAAVVGAFLLLQYAIEAIARRAVAAVGVWL
jgi:hypothetical protein